jgi:hypothetical protein
MKPDFSLKFSKDTQMSFFIERGLGDLWSKQLVFGIKDVRRSYSSRPISKDRGIILCTLSVRSVTEKLDSTQHASYITLWYFSLLYCVVNNHLFLCDIKFTPSLEFHMNLRSVDQMASECAPAKFAALIYCIIL